MEKHIKLTEGRVKQFTTRLWESVYEAKTPLKAVFVKAAEPIPFKDISKKKFRPISIGSDWGSNFDCAWFKFSGNIPREWKGKEVFAAIDIGGEAALFSNDGTPLTGFTNLMSTWDRHMRKALFPLKNTSGKVSLTVEGAASYLFGRQLSSVFKQADLVVLNRPKWELYHDYFFMWNLATHLPEDSIRRAKLFSVLNGIINTYENGSPENVKKCLLMSKKTINNGVNASAPQVSAIGHSHIDTAWLWPLRETRRKVGRTFSTVIKLMEEYPDYKFGASQAQLYQFCKENYPGLYAKIKKAVKAKKWELQGGMWVEADCNLISGESMVRQFLYGKKFFKEEFGIEVDNLWLPDVFGYSAAMPQILKKCGVNYFLTQKLSWSQFNKFPHHTFNWEGLDGTKIFTHFPPSNSYNDRSEPWEFIKAQKEFLEKDRANRWISLFGFGDGGGGPTRHHLEFLKRSKNCEELPAVKQEFAKDFFPKCEKDIKDPLIWRGELYLEFHRGTYTTHARNKKNNRKSEFLLREAEVFSVLSKNPSKKEELDRLWKLVLLNQFHDIIPGSSIPEVYRDSTKQYSDILKSGEVLVTDGLKALVSKIDTSAGKRPVVIFNSLSFDRESPVLLPKEKSGVIDSSGAPVPSQMTEGGLLFTASVPAFGYAVYYISEKVDFESGLKVTKNSLENEFLKVFFAKDGSIISLFDKENNREVVKNSGKANFFKVYDEKGEDAWDTHIYHEELSFETPKLVRTEILEAGPVRAALRQTYKIGGSTIIQEIRLAKDSRKLEFSTLVNWQEKERLLKVFFDTSVNSLKAKYDIQFGCVERPAHRNTLWDMAKFEVCAQKWADYSEEGYGVSLLNDCKYGHGVKEGTMSLTLLRSPKHPDPAQMLSSATLKIAYPETDQGLHEFTYVLMPHAGSLIEAGTVKAAYDLNVPLRAVKTVSKKGALLPIHSFISVNSGDIIIDTVKKSEDAKGTVLRFYEPHGSRQSVELDINIPFKNAYLTDMLERKEKQLKSEAGRIKLEVKPFEIITLKLE